MSKKRKSAESSHDDEPTTTDDSDATFQQLDSSAKRGRLASVSNTTLLQDLPVEMLECILVKAVAMEVKDLKLAESVWPEKTNLVISRLRRVCTQWRNILTSNIFRSEVDKTLHDIAPELIRLELLQQSPMHLVAFQVTTVKDETFMLCKFGDQGIIVVYERNNTAVVKNVIALPGMRPLELAGCSVSSCVYVLDMESTCFSVLRIRKDLENKFHISPWISDLTMPISTMSVSSSGNLIILSRELLSGELLSGLHKPMPSLVKIYNAFGFLQQELSLSPDIFSIRYVTNVIETSNGNLLLVSVNERGRLLLTKIDRIGRILRQYESDLWGDFVVGVAGISDGRILVSDRHSSMELLDSELNPLDVVGQQSYEGQFVFPSKLHYNRERNEIMRVCDLISSKTKVLTIFRFTEK